ncbi:MAG: sulfotransferase family 2 domain-containing protein [Cyanobacteria bacterium J06621_11]
MIISHKHKFIFIKTEKTAGTSVEIALSKFCGDDDIITPLVPKDEKIRREISGRSAQNYLVPKDKYTPRKWAKLLLKGKPSEFYNHITAREVKQFVSQDVWDSYFKFCFERNPWDKVISWYYWRYKSEPRPSITAFIRSGEAKKVSGYPLYTINGQVVADKIGLFENLTEELASISTQLQLPTKIELPQTKSGFRKDRRHYSDILTEIEKAAIATLFQREIQLLGYTYS